MSVIEQIAKQSAKLSADRQREVLDFVEFVATRTKTNGTGKGQRTTATRQVANKVRAGWAAAFNRMRRNGDDALLDTTTDNLSDWDEKEWKW